MSSTTPGRESGSPPPPPPGDDYSRTQTLRRSVADRLGAPGGQAGGGQAAHGQADPAAGAPRSATSAGEAPVNGTSRPATVAGGPRRVRLSISRIDPWSAMKLSFLLSVALGIMIVVAAALVWFVLDSMQVFADIEDLLVSIGSESFLQLMDYLAFDRVMSFATIVGVVDILLLTALGTIGAFLYNIVAALVGGLHMTLTDD
jgi:hypothetical protein